LFATANPSIGGSEPSIEAQPAIVRRPVAGARIWVAFYFVWVTTARSRVAPDREPVVHAREENIARGD
jgi:hypothetical protein